MLEALGLTEHEERAYQRLVTLSAESAEDLAAALAIEARVAVTVLAGPGGEGAGGQVRSPIPTASRPHRPRSHSARWSRNARKALRRAQMELATLADTYRSGAADRTLVDVMEVVRGHQAVAQRFLQLQRGARTEVLAFVKSSVAVVPPEDNEDEDRALRRGVAYRLVIEAGAFERPGDFDVVREMVEAGGDCRVRQRCPLRLLVVDREIASLPLLGDQDDRGSGALLVHPSGLLDALLALFELARAGGAPFLLSYG